MMLDNQTLALIAVGASVAANCQPCLEHNAGSALKCGASGEKISEAIEVGKRVRQGAAAKMDKFAQTINSTVASEIGVLDGVCKCGTLDETREVING
jgi:AhpD family alkylhydroperoxidase